MSIATRVEQMPISIRKRLKALIASLLPETVTLVIAGVFAHIGSNVSLRIVVAAVICGFVLVALAEYVLTYKPLLEYQEEELTNFFNEHLSMIESEIEDLNSKDIEVRVNIMMKSSGILDDPTVELTYVASENDYSDEELALEFEFGEGCAGNVIADNKPKVSKSPPEATRWPEAWGTTSEQDLATEHLCTIIGVPIYGPKDTNQSEPIGVFIIDSEDPIHRVFDEPEATVWEDYDFGSTEIVTRAAEHAKNVGILV